MSSSSGGQKYKIKGLAGLGSFVGESVPFSFQIVEVTWATYISWFMITFFVSKSLTLGQVLLRLQLSDHSWEQLPAFKGSCD